MRKDKLQSKHTIKQGDEEKLVSAPNQQSLLEASATSQVELHAAH